MFDLTWRFLLVGIGMSLFNGPNQMLLMSVGARGTMGAASALSNLSARLGSVFGPLMLSITWSFLPGFALHMSIGMFVLVVLGTLAVLCAWLVRPRSQDVPLFLWNSRRSADNYRDDQQ